MNFPIFSFLPTTRVAADGHVYTHTRPFCDNVNLSPNQLLHYRYYLTFVQVIYHCACFHITI